MIFQAITEAKIFLLNWVPERRVRLRDAVGSDDVAGEAPLPRAPREPRDAVAVQVVAALVEARVALVAIAGVHAHGPPLVIRPAASFRLESVTFSATRQDVAQDYRESK